MCVYPEFGQRTHCRAGNDALLIQLHAMNRRVSRLRREYLYRKSLQGAQSEEYEKKRAIRQALQEGKALPNELRKEAAALKRKVDLEDDNTAVQRTNVDDEYGDLGVVDPQARLTLFIAVYCQNAPAQGKRL
jgi:hypothetical protein